MLNEFVDLKNYCRHRLSTRKNKQATRSVIRGGLITVDEKKG